MVRYTFCWLMLVVFLLTVVPVHYCHAIETVPTKKVLILYSYGADIPIQTLFTRGLQNQLQHDTAYKVDYVYEFLELGRYSSNEEYGQLLSRFLKEKYATNPPDLIISHLTAAADFMIQYGEQTFPGIPAVLGISEGEGEPRNSLPTNYSEVIGTFGVKTAVDLILETQPNTQRIYVVAGDSERERKVVATFKNQVTSFADRIEFIYLDQIPFDQMLATIQEVKDNSVILYLFLFRDAAGNSFVPGEALKRMYQVAHVPIYGSVSIFVGQGSIGGYMASQEILGKIAGESGLQVLQGNLPAHASVRKAAAEYVFDARELKRWGIDEHQLPAGSKIMFKEPTIWESYRWHVLGAIILILLEAVLVFALLVNRRRRKKAEATILQLNEYLAKNLHELQDINTTLEEEIMDRQAAQEKLRDSQERYEALLKQSSEAIAVIDFDSTCIIEINEAFSTMFGYSPAEVVGLTITDLGLLTPEEIAKMNTTLAGTRAWTATTRRYRRKSGQLIYSEMSASLIHYRGKQLKLLSYRDVTEQQRLHAVIQTQLKLAGDVQRALLPCGYQDDNITIRTIFQPLTIVSGDFYGFRFTRDGKRLHGYLLDVTGHGVAAALHTAAISSMINNLMDNAEAWTLETLSQLNHHVSNYFQDNSLVALVAFTLDFSSCKLTCLSCGINYILTSTRGTTGIVTVPGMYLGVTAMPEFKTVTIPVQHGDTFYFMTDGIYDSLPAEIVENASQFEITTAAMEQLPLSRKNLDDRTALCLNINGLKSRPVFFDYSNPAERPRIYKRINCLLSEQAGAAYPKVGVALGEALSNAVRSGPHVQIKINQIGSRLILRVRDDGKGFAGNAKIDELMKLGLEQVFLTLLDAEHGRGIPIMMTWTDKLLYNKQGTEVMLIKQLAN